jgi:Uncharacterized alpha/beta hydrolase domain (DUF2235)
MMATRSSSSGSAAVQYTARSLSGLICKCGVLKLGAPLSIEQLYARYRIYDAPTIRSLAAKPLPQNASIEEQWLTKYSRPTKVKFVGVRDTVGSLGLRMDISKDLLRKMAKEERCLFLALGHASNQVNALWKLVIILTNGAAEDPVKQRLEGAQTQVPSGGSRSVR